MSWAQRNDINQTALPDDHSAKALQTSVFACGARRSREKVKEKSHSCCIMRFSSTESSQKQGKEKREAKVFVAKNDKKE